MDWLYYIYIGHQDNHLLIKYIKYYNNNNNNNNIQNNNNNNNNDNNNNNNYYYLKIICWVQKRVLNV